MQALRFVRRAVDRLERGATTFGATLLALVVVVAGAELVMRSTTGSSWIEAGDLSMLMALTMYLIGYPALLNRDEDIRMDYFYVWMPWQVRRVLDAATAAAILVFFVILFFKSIALFQLGLRFRHPVLAMPAAVVYAPMMAGALFGLIVAVRKLIDGLADLRTPPTEPGGGGRHP